MVNDMDIPVSEIFPFGVQYHRAPTPLESEWDGDLRTIAGCGYTHVQFRPQWRWHERVRGCYEFSDLDRLMDTAWRHRLRVILKVQLETAPDWVFTELGGTRIGLNGTPIMPISHAAFYVGGWWPCFDNPLVAEAAADFAETLAARYREHPALWFFNAWNEPRSRPLGQCRCNHSVRSYRDYLKARFGSIEKLNAGYGKAWSSFETVFPPDSHSDYVELMLWREWAGHAVAAQVKMSADAIRKGAPGRAVMCHVGCSSLVQDPVCDTSDDLLNSAAVDWYGCSFPIRLLPECELDYHDAFHQSAWLRRVDGNYWCQEFYTNYSNYTPEADPAFVEQAVWMALASGCRGLTFWQYRSERFGEESNGWGMREVDGAPTPRSRRCDRVAAELRKWGSRIAGSSPVKSRIALLFDRRNDLLMRIRHIDTPLFRLDTVDGDCDYDYKQQLSGGHYLWRRSGYSCDMVTGNDDFTAYSLLSVGVWEMVPERSAEALRKFVESGGVLLVEYPFACRDERSWLSLRRPSSGLDELLGCREERRLALAAGELRKIGYGNGKVDMAGGVRVVLSPVGGRTIGVWEDGVPAVVVNQVGRGKVITCGGSVAVAVAQHPKSPGRVPELYQLALAAAGLTPGDAELWSAERRSAKERLLFWFSVQDHPVERRVPEGFSVLYHGPEVEKCGDRLIIYKHGSAVLVGPVQKEDGDDG